MNILEHILRGKHLKHEDMQDVMQKMLKGSYPGEWVAAFLVAMRAKGETVEELLAAVQVLQQLVTPVHLGDVDHVVDVVGTGGDGHSTFNISTASMLVAASCGAKVAKHGNKGVSSRSGSADCLQALGVSLDANALQIARSIEEHGLGFMFAPNHHPAMRYVANIRKTLGVRTFFNLLGPLTNPAGVKRMLLGVYHRKWLEPLASVLQHLGFEHAWVVHAHNGLDEISSACPTDVCEVKNHTMRTFTIQPQDYGFAPHDLQTLCVENADQSAYVIRQVLQNNTQGHLSACLDMMLINAAAVLYLAAKVNNLQDGIAMAREGIVSQKAWYKLQALQSKAVV